MQRRKGISRWWLLPSVVAPLFVASATFATIIVYQEDFERFSAGDLPGQFGWTQVGASTKLRIDAANGNHYVTGADSDSCWAAFTNKFRFPDDARTIVLEARVHYRGQSNQLITMLNAASQTVFSMGVHGTNATFRLRNASGAEVFLGNGPDPNNLTSFPPTTRSG